MELCEIKNMFLRQVLQRAVDNGWSYKTRADGVRIIDSLDVAGDHWDGETFDCFFPYTEDGLRRATMFCARDADK